MPRSTTPVATSPVTGFALALASAATFAFSGIFASALMTAGWSPGAAAITRIGLAALVLAPPTLIMMRGEWHLVRRAWKQVLLFGLLAVAGCQLAFFLAVEHIAPSLALLIEFMGPVLLMLFLWARTRIAPHRITLLGALIAFAGLITISGIAVGGALHPLGIFFALIAAVGNATFYATGASTEHGIAPLPFVGIGLFVAAVALALASFTGFLPFIATPGPVTLAGSPVSLWVPIAGMVLVSTVLAYVLGVGASRLLGATVASFTGYSEPLFAIVWSILLLGIAPTLSQWIGAALIIGGVAAVKVGELMRARV